VPRNQPRALGVPGVALPQSHDRHQLRNVLPGADDVDDPTALQIRPDRRGAQRQAKMKARRLHRRRAIGSSRQCIAVTCMTGPGVSRSRNSR
jgi:hypothetical protein